MKEWPWEKKREWSVKGLVGADSSHFLLLPIHCVLLDLGIWYQEGKPVMHEVKLAPLLLRLGDQGPLCRGRGGGGVGTRLFKATEREVAESGLTCRFPGLRL